MDVCCVAEEAAQQFSNAAESVASASQGDPGVIEHHLEEVQHRRPDSDVSQDFCTSVVGIK